jgi:hypothetical protein
VCLTVVFFIAFVFLCSFLFLIALYGSYVRSVMYRFYIVCVSRFLHSFRIKGRCCRTGRFVAFFAASFVRSYPGDWPAFSRAGNSGFSARFYRRPRPALSRVGPALRTGAFSVGPALSRVRPALKTGALLLPERPTGRCLVRGV